MKKLTFVVAHGAWTGGWSWEKVAIRLRASGHEIYVPTLSGLSERSHLAKFPIDLDTHIADVANEIEFKDLENVTLIGHSYGGIVATGVAEKMLRRLSAIVFLDAFVPNDNTSFSDIDPNWNEQGPLVAPPPFPLPKEIAAKVTPQPIRTMTQKIRVTGAYEKIKQKTYIVCTGWNGPFGDIALKFRSDPAWTVREIDSGHDAPWEAPEKLSELLIEAAR